VTAIKKLAVFLFATYYNYRSFVAFVIKNLV